MSDETITKPCKRCGNNFTTRKPLRGKSSNHCDQCKKIMGVERTKKYYLAHRDTINARRNAAYAAKHASVLEPTA